jgi:hypothetical protein
MNAQPNKRGGQKPARHKDTKGKPNVKFRDMTPTKDAKGGLTTVKDSHDRYG